MSEIQTHEPTIDSSKSLTEEQIKSFSEEVLKAIESSEGQLSQLTLEEITDFMRAGSFFIIKGEENFIGYALLRHIGKSLLYISTVYINPDYRNRGYASMLLTEISNSFPHHNLVLDTQNPSMDNSAKKAGFFPLRWNQFNTRLKVYLQGLKTDARSYVTDSARDIVERNTSSQITGYAEHIPWRILFKPAKPTLATPAEL